MSDSEFELIRDLIAPAARSRNDVLLGIGDDCALLDIPPGQQLAVSLDTLVADRHFLADCDPASLGFKALAVNLSDLAAMGAEPAWVTLGLTMPSPDRSWLESFLQGFNELAARFDVQLVGGDLTRGPLTLSLQAHGFVPVSQALRRSGASAGDRVYVSGTLGDAALALRQINGGTAPVSELREALERPRPRVELGLALRGIATAAIDLSDGLASDLQHLCNASRCGAMIDTAALPLSETYTRLQPDWKLAVTGGDDYELCFTAAAEDQRRLETISGSLNLQLTCIGEICQGKEISFHEQDGTVTTGLSGFDQFRSI